MADGRGDDLKSRLAGGTGNLQTEFSGISHYLGEQRMASSVFGNPCNNNALRKASRNLGNLFDDVVAPSGLRAAQFGILFHVDALTAPTMKALARELVMDLSALGHTLKPLIRDGFVELQPNAEDRRSKLVVLTALGNKKLSETIKLWREAQSRVETVLGAEPALRLREMLMTMASEEFAAAFRNAKPLSRPR